MEKMVEMKLSIVIPHYNSAELLEKLLSTIPNIPEIQIIVVDDKSTEKLDILKKCQQKYTGQNVEFYVNEFEKGAGGARNTGLKYVKGEWILFADADDFFLPEFYEVVKKYFNEEYDLVYFVPTSIELATGKQSDRHIYAQKIIFKYLEHNNDRNYLQMKYMITSPCSKLIRMKVINQNSIKFDETIVANDAMASMQISYHANKVTASKEIIYCITKQPGTLTTEITQERFEARMQVYYRRHRYLKDHLQKKDYRILLFGARSRLRSIVKNRLGWKFYIKVLFDIVQNGIPIWREFSPLYYYDVCGDLLSRFAKPKKTFEKESGL